VHITCFRPGAAELTQVVGAQLTNKTHFYCEKLNSYEHLLILRWHVPPGSTAYVSDHAMTMTRAQNVQLVVTQRI